MAVGILGQKLAAAITSPQQTITAIATDTPLAFDAVSYDPSSMVDLDNNRILILRPGAYRASLMVEFSPLADENAEVEMYGIITAEIFGRVAIQLIPLAERVVGSAGQAYVVYSMTGTAMLEAGDAISAHVNLFTLGAGATEVRVQSSSLAIEQIRPIASTTGGGAVPGPVQGIPAPALDVSPAVTFGLSPDVGAGLRYARNDHNHGTPPNPGGGSLSTLEDLLAADVALTSGAFGSGPSLDLTKGTWMVWGRGAYAHTQLTAIGQRLIDLAGGTVTYDEAEQQTSASGSGYESQCLSLAIITVVTPFTLTMQARPDQTGAVMKRDTLNPAGTIPTATRLVALKIAD